MLSGQRSRWFVRAVTHRPRPRPGGHGDTFGVLSLAGGSPTMASIAALPVLIGLVAGLRDLNPRPLLRELVALRAVRPPGADA